MARRSLAVRERPFRLERALALGRDRVKRHRAAGRLPGAPAVGPAAGRAYHEPVTDFRYAVCDVFTDRPLAGNQLAVFTDARRIPERLLQPLARELGLGDRAGISGAVGVSTKGSHHTTASTEGRGGEAKRRADGGSGCSSPVPSPSGSASRGRGLRWASCQSRTVP